MPGDSLQDSGPDSPGAAKIAACLSCRRSKLKCARSSTSSACLKCQARGTDCETPEYHIGRYRGVKNKRSGLDKAVHQIEQAIRSKRSKIGHDVPSPQDLQELLSKTVEVLPQLQTTGGENTLQLAATPASGVFWDGQFTGNDIPSMTIAADRQNEDDNLGLDSAENPLQLLANTSELLRMGKSLETRPATPRLVDTSAHQSPTKDSVGGKDLQAFFGRIRPRLDTDSSLDPIELGIVTVSESERLFAFFYQNLSHTRWGLDSVIHTTDFVRCRSLFLFTSILNASALFVPTADALSKRLSNHCRKLAHTVTKSRFRSVEIVLAFMINIPWLSPGDHWADDETCSYLAMALTVAMDLSLDKIVVPSPNGPQAAKPGISRSDCVDGVKALSLDGFDHVDSFSDLGRRLLRRRERTWLALFVLERGVCLARGRNYTLPLTPLVETCDLWHTSDIADTWDGSIVSTAVLRRDLASLIARIKEICDSRRATVNGSVTVQNIKMEIDSFFDWWYATWPAQIGDNELFKLPPYVEILASHTRLSMYSSVINHPSAPVEVKHFFRSAGLSSALNVLRAAVQGENQLKSMPNNTAIMISFAACFALGLSTVGNGTGSRLAPSVRSLIEETADVLERIGSTPEHRKGASALFARQLRRIVYSNPRPVGDGSQNIQRTDQEVQVPLEETQTAGQTGSAYRNGHSESSPFERLPFSNMSNDQIIDAINNAGVGLEGLWDEFQFDESTGLEWLNWPT